MTVSTIVPLLIPHLKISTHMPISRALRRTFETTSAPAYQTSKNETGVSVIIPTFCLWQANAFVYDNDPEWHHRMAETSIMYAIS